MAMINVNDILTWGRLVKSWARQLNYIGRAAPGDPSARIPAGAPADAIPATFNCGRVVGPADFQQPGMTMSRADFLNLIARVVASPDVPPLPRKPDGKDSPLLELPPEIKWVTFVQGTADHLVIRLPPAQIVAETEAALQHGTGVYMVRDFYRSLFVCLGGQIELAPPASYDPMVMHAQRIGDYTISYCQ